MTCLGWPYAERRARRCFTMKETEFNGKLKEKRTKAMFGYVNV